MLKKDSLLQKYHDLKESGSTSDWPLLLANVLHKLLLMKFVGVPSPWKSYTWQTELNDFKTANRVIMNESPDLLAITEEQGYKDSNISDNGYGITLGTFGRTFSVGRRAIINDDLEALRRQPERFGRSASRTLAKQCVAAIENDGKAYDGLSLFATTHKGGANFQGNVTIDNSAAGILAVSKAMTAISKAQDETGEKMGLIPKYLLVPPDLEDGALRLTQGQSFMPISTTGGTTVVGKAARLEVLVEPFFTSATESYVMADPADCPVIEVGFLDGKQTPDLLVKRINAVNLAGGDDEWGYEFDDIEFKIRWDFAVQRAMYQGIFRMSS
jgi:hypothetical protein